MIVEAPDGKVIEFPDSMDPKAIETAMAKEYGGKSVQSATPAKMSDLASQKGKELLSNIPGSVGNLLGNILSELSPYTPSEGFKVPGLNLAKNLFMTAMGDPNRVNAVGENLAGRYGGWDKIQNTAVNDPAGFAADLSTILGLGGATVGMAGKSNLSSILSKASEYSNPLSMISKPLRVARGALGATSLPESLYGRAMKMPPGSVRDEVRGKILKTMLRDEGAPLTSRTLGNIKNEIKPIYEGIDQTLKDLQASGTTIDINQVLQNLEGLKGKFLNRLDPQAYLNAIDSVKREAINHQFNIMEQQQAVGAGTTYNPSRPLSASNFPQSTAKTVSTPTGKMGIFDANELKKGIHSEIESYYSKAQKPETGRVGIKNDVDAEAKSALAMEIAKSIVGNPEVPIQTRLDMIRGQGLMNARKWVERATNRASNADPVSLGGLLFGTMVEGGIPSMVAYRIATGQAMLSKLAVGIANGSKKLRVAGTVARPTVLGIYQGQQFSGGLNKPISMEVQQ